MTSTVAPIQIHQKSARSKMLPLPTGLPEIDNEETERLEDILMSEAPGEWYAVIPAHVLSDNRLSSSAKVVFAAIASFSANWTNEPYASHAQIAERAGMNVRSIVRPLREIKEAGYLNVNRRGRRLTNTYSVTTLKCDITEKCIPNPAWNDDANERPLSIKRIQKRNSTQPSINHAEAIYDYYVNNVRPGPKSDTLRSITKLLAQYTYEDLRTAAEAYAASREGQAEKQYRYSPNNFFGRKEYFKDYLKQQSDQLPAKPPPKELTQEEQEVRQRLIDAGQD